MKVIDGGITSAKGFFAAGGAAGAIHRLIKTEEVGEKS